MTDELSDQSDADAVQAAAEAAEPAVEDEVVAPVVSVEDVAEIDQAKLEEQAPLLAAATATFDAAVAAAEEQFRLAPVEYEDDGVTEKPRVQKAVTDEDGFWSAIRAADAAYAETTAGFEARKPANPQPVA